MYSKLHTVAVESGAKVHHFGNNLLLLQLKTHKSKLSSRHLARCFLLPQGVADSRSGILNVADPRDAGEFNNDDGAHSGKYFVRYVYVDEDDYTDENVYVIQ